MINDSTKNNAHANEYYRFAQLSDPHLSSPGIPNPIRLINKRVLGYLSWLRKRRHVHKRWVAELAVEVLQNLQVSHYVITGDLTHIGLKNEFEQVTTWLHRIGDPHNVTVIPGNHDLYVNERWDRSFINWNDYMCGDNQSSLAPESGNSALQGLKQNFPTLRLRGNIAFIGVSSVFAAPWFRATGYINKEQLERLHNMLQIPKLKNYCKVLLIHHPISTESISLRKRLINHSQLTDILQHSPVHLILHGHGHRTALETLNCQRNVRVPIIGAASSSSISRKEQYHAEFLLFDVSLKSENWNIKVQNYKLDLPNKNFIVTSTRTFKMPASL